MQFERSSYLWGREGVIKYAIVWDMEFYNLKYFKFSQVLFCFVFFKIIIIIVKYLLYK